MTNDYAMILNGVAHILIIALAVHIVLGRDKKK